jgi:uncharacterized repeat protein (TIGR01451 family)
MYTKRLARLFVSAASALLFSLLLNVMISYSQPTAELARTDFAWSNSTLSANPIEAASAWQQVGPAGFTSGEAWGTFLAIWNGTPYVAYADDYTVHGWKASVMKFNGTTWEQVGAAGFTAGAARFIVLALDAYGTPYIAYQDEAHGNKASVMKFNGAAWVQVGAAGFTGGQASHLSMALDVDGTPYLSYRDSANSDKASVMKFNGTAWVQVGAAGFSAGPAWYTALGLADGTPYMAYNDEANYNKASMMKFNGTAWEQVGVAGFSVDVALYVSLALDSDGTPYVAYRDQGNSAKASVMKFNGTAWVQVGTAGFSAGAVTFTSLALGVDGTPFVAYTDNAYGDRASVMKFNGATWEQVGAAGFSAGVASSTSLALDNDDTPFVAYRDVANGSRASVMKYAELAAPAAFDKTTPANGATAVSLSPTLTWETSGGADSYEYCLGSSSGACDLLDWTNVGEDTSVALSDLDTATTYHWQVRAVNTGGTTYANDNTWWSFTTVPDAPAAFGKTVPANGATAVSLSPTLTWETSGGADSYEYCLGSSSGACDLLDWTNVGEDTSVALSDLDTATTYHWQVRAVNTGGTTYANDNTWWSFTTVPDAPAAFDKTTPANGATAVSLSPTLTWETSGGADSYEYCLGSSSGACDLLDWTNVGEDTSVALSDLDTATTYHWQVRAVNTGGTTEADSGVWWSFTTTLDEPVTNVILHRRPLGEVLVSNPVRFAVTADGTRPFTYTWSLNGDVVGENRYIYEHLFTAAGTYTVGVTVVNLLNAVYTETLVTVVEPVAGLPDLSLSDKLSSLSFVESGDVFTYTLLLRNTADVVATAVLTDPIPAYTTYLPGSASASNGGDVALIDDAIVWHGEIISGTPVLIQFAVTVGDAPIGAQIVNNATLADGLGNLLELASSATFNPGYRLTINDGALATNMPTVTLRYAWNVSDAITHVQFSNDGGFGAGASAWLPVNPTDPTLVDWALDVYGDFRMPYLVFARFRDTEGQTYGPIMDWIIYDPVAPRIVSVEIIPGTGLAQAFGNGVIVRITTTDGNTGVAHVHLSHTEDFANYEEVVVTSPTTDVLWTLGSGGKVYVRAVDRAGNISAPVSADTVQHLIFLPLVIQANPSNGQANVGQDSLMN